MLPSAARATRIAYKFAFRARLGRDVCVHGVRIPSPAWRISRVRKFHSSRTLLKSISSPRPDQPNDPDPPCEKDEFNVEAKGSQETAPEVGHDAVDKEVSEHPDVCSDRMQKCDAEENLTGENLLDSTRSFSERLQKGREDAQGGYGSALKRSMRNRLPIEIPPVMVPSWFLARNVKLWEELAIEKIEREMSDSSKSGNWLRLGVRDMESGRQVLTTSWWQEDVGRFLMDKSSTFEDQWIVDPALNLSKRKLILDHIENKLTCMRKNTDDVATILPEKPPAKDTISETRKCSQLPTNDSQIHPWTRTEIKATISGGFSAVGPDVKASFPAAKSNLFLHCPLDGRIDFLVENVEAIATELGADIIRLDAQDLAQLAGNYIEGTEPEYESMRLLSYDTFSLRSNQEMNEDVEENGESDEEALEETSQESTRPKSSPGAKQMNKGLVVVELGRGAMENVAQYFTSALGLGLKPKDRDSAGGVAQRPRSSSTMQWDDIKLGALLETLIDSTGLKNADDKPRTIYKSTGKLPIPPDQTEDQLNISLNHLLSNPMKSKIEANLQVSQAPAEKTIPPRMSRRTIILIKDFREICMTRYGDSIVNKLSEIIWKRRSEGEPIMYVGVSSNSEIFAEASQSNVKAIQSEHGSSYYRSIYVPTVEPNVAKMFNGWELSNGNPNKWQLASWRQTRDINMRHIQDVIGRVDPGSIGSPDFATFELLQEFSSHSLNTRVLTFDEVHRIALTAVGLRELHPDEVEVRPIHVFMAITLLRASDAAKFSWCESEKNRETESRGTSFSSLNPKSAKSSKTTIEEVRKTANTYEKRLLNNVIDASSIRTTFSDVHATTETIDALKTLTTLSLIRPDAFKYGVLATDKIPGLLLYGPPGTGKTLLAKAVAKESGATVLDISGSEVYDMYVGEGEKNVRAIFSLSRKLSPCVVFIDEADAIFGSRTNSRNQTNHRDIVNQFLREWDGMSEMSVFIMVATNRPFDLDDAVLRRLPRRLLVDLPLEKDREAILRIHLKEELLASEVSLRELAGLTPFYSGSDLKNMSVAAALACVKEENAAASRAKESGDAEFKLPEKRTLYKRHFETAMEEVNASVGEDMSSLASIRKFDEQYGDRRGRRKKHGWGFVTRTEELEDGRTRVRN